MVRTRQPTIERARDIVGAEIELVSTERDGFERFLSRLRDLQASGPDRDSPEGPAAATATVAGGTPTPSGGLATVRTAYRETVMAVPHYESEYGDTLAESLAAEVGTPLAGHIVDGQVLTPTVYHALVEASERARDDREDFLRVLERERDSLLEVEAELNDIERRVVDLQRRIPDAAGSDELATIDDRLAAIERECTDLANRRAELIHNRSVRKVSGIDDTSLLQYLYEDMETVTPALSDLADCLDTVRYGRERCLR